MSHPKTRSQTKKIEDMKTAGESADGVPTNSGVAADGAAASNPLNPPKPSSVFATPERSVDGEKSDNAQPPGGRRSSVVGSVTGSHTSRRSQRTALEAQRKQIELEIAIEKAKLRDKAASERAKAQEEIAKNGEEVLEKQLAARIAQVEAALAAVDEEGDERRSQSLAASARRVQEWVDQSPPMNCLAEIENTCPTQPPPAMEVKTYEPLPHPSTQSPRTRDVSSEQRRDRTELIEAIATMFRPRPRQAYELPKFDGNPADWITFKRSYERSTAAYKFESFENLARLQQALIGPAKAAVETILRTSDDPEEVMRVLEEEFGHPGAIIECALKMIRNSPRVTDNGHELKKFTNVVRNCVSLLKTVKADGYVNNPQIVSELLNKLTPSQCVLYSKFAKNRDRETTMDLRVSPSLDILLEFLNEESSAAAYLMPPSLASPRSANPAPQPQPRPRVMPAPRNVHHVALVSTAPLNSASSPRVLDCVLCHDNHTLPTCAQFLAFTNDERWETVKENKLCFKCLSQRHSRMFCRAKRCDQCRAPHHPLLHYTRPASEQAPLPPPSLPEAEFEQVSSVSGHCSKALLKIVPVTIVREDGKAIKTHALLDDGATVSLMKDSLLHPDIGESCPLTIMAANGQSVTDSKSRKVSVVIRGPNEQSHKVNVRTLSQLNLPSQVVPETVFDNAHLKDLRGLVQCSATDNGENREVAGEAKPLILLGQDNWDLIVGREIREGESSQPVASLTQLGWVIHGPIGSKQSFTSDTDRESVHCLAVVSRLDLDVHKVDKNQVVFESIVNNSETNCENENTKQANFTDSKPRHTIEGGLEVGSLRKQEDPICTSNCRKNVNRFAGIERHIEWDPTYSVDYEAQVERPMKKRRVEQVQNTHRYTPLNEVQRKNNLQRKFKPTRGCRIVNKEIVKVRNSFQNMNLKNKLMLKKAINHVEKLNAKDLLKYSAQEDYQSLKGDTDPFLEELSKDMTNNLVIHNDTEFKLNDKPISVIDKTNTKKKNVTVKKYANNAIKNEGNFTEEILRIECSLKLEGDIKDDYDNFLNEERKDPVSFMTLTTNHVDKNDYDLQSLLIMSAISSKTNESADNFEVNHDFNKHNDNDNYNFSDDLKVFKEKGITSPMKVSSENITDLMTIKPLRAEINYRQKYLVTKYVNKWKTFVKTKSNYQTRERQATLDNFFDKLVKKKNNLTPEHNKAKLVAKDYNTYQHRYKVQKHIIALQKAKLEEQNRIIEQLKYNKIVEASQQSVDEMREEVRKAYYEIDRQLKPKIKCLTNELKVHDIQETSLVLHCLKVPQFLKRMEKRAREREEKHAMIRERRKQMEEERIRLKQQAEIAKAEMDKEEKIKRIQELKEKRKREKIEGIRKKQHAERMRSLNVMADLHYEKYLVAKYGIRPLRLLIEIKRDNIEKAKAHYTFQLKKNIFLHWMWYTEDMLFERNYLAEDFYKKKILKKIFHGFMENHHEYVLKKQVAEDYYDFYVIKLAFKMFREGIQIIKKENEAKWQKAEKYCDSNLLFKTFTCWRTLPALNALQREQEARKARWREKVLLVVPDYTPPDD